MNCAILPCLTHGRTCACPPCGDEATAQQTSGDNTVPVCTYHDRYVENPYRHGTLTYLTHGRLVAA